MAEPSITAALQASDDPMQAPNWLKWRADGFNLRAMPKGWPADDDPFIGAMDSEQLADEVARSHNAILVHVQRDGFTRSPTGEPSND